MRLTSAWWDPACHFSQAASYLKSGIMRRTSSHKTHLAQKHSFLCHSAGVSCAHSLKTAYSGEVGQRLLASGFDFCSDASGSFRVLFIKGKMPIGPERKTSSRFVFASFCLLFAAPYHSSNMTTEETFTCTFFDNSLEDR
jgi:hypothetical protein